MKERNAIPVTRVLFAIGLVTAGILARAACTKEVIKEVPVPGTPTVITREVPMTLPALAKAIQEGKIDVGKNYGLAPGQRYHNIHAMVLGLRCTTCHVTTTDTIQNVFTAQDVSPRAPGPVDKTACLGCHSAGGPATELYDSGG